ncbi:hypothetical protein DS2_10863 [Catenovulum agarivorans DS-2]|uniref:Glycoside hydrolase family 49 N-terminal domain-containing protein n=1 Tax=Catenovulum agarivorans DS-2 TaxID=1328313 RepID=W7QLH0_9ALTE|nr:hypothetical protein [Catenovulum agarivorans]EWH09782.1 hypothetical protein DS2_10863 [Catenovulum agarivorans DS-2]
MSIQTLLSKLLFVALLLTGCKTNITTNADSSNTQQPSALQVEHVVTYAYQDLPDGVHSSKFSIDVEGQSVVLLQTTPPPAEMAINIKPGSQDGAKSYRQTQRSFSWGQFSFDPTKGPVNVQVSKLDENSGDVRDIIIRPKQLSGIAYKVVNKDLANRTVQLQILQSNRKLSVEFVDDRYAVEKDLPLDALLIFADQAEYMDYSAPPAKEASDTYVVKANEGFDPQKAEQATAVYFEAGTHNLGLWWVPTKVKHVYLAGGAYVIGSINSDHAGKNGQTGYTLSGRGVISGEKFAWRADTRTQGQTVCVDKNGYSTGCPSDGVKPVDIDQNDFLVEGITLVNIPFYAFSVRPESSFPRSEVKGTVRNVKLMGMWRYNNDGFDLPANIKLSDCFVAAMDDAFKVYHNNSSVKDCVVWQMDNGGIFQFGWYPKSVDTALIENIHVIHTEWTGLNKNRGLANLTERPSTDTRSGTIKNIHFKNIYMEGPVSRVFYLRNEFYPNQSYANWTFENIHVESIPSYQELVNIKQKFGGNGQLSPDLLFNAVESLSNTASIKDIIFKNVYIAGEKMTQANATTTGRFTLTLQEGETVTFE